MTSSYFNPLHPEQRDDPHRLLHRLRREDPVHRSPLLGAWVLTRHEDVQAALRDRRFGSALQHWRGYGRYFYRGRLGAFTPTAQTYRQWMILSDPPDHPRLRRLVAKAFTPSGVAGLRPRITELVQRLLGPLRDRPHWDVVEDLAAPLPVRVICELLGVPADRAAEVTRYSQDLLPSFSPALSSAATDRVDAAIEGLSELFRALVAERREDRGGDDLLARLVAARDEQDRLSEDELVANAILLVFAGHMSAVQLVAGTVQLLIEHAGEQRRLREQPERIPRVVDEALRWVAPLQLLYRCTREPVAMRGRTIPANELVLLSLAAANRDPEVYPQPDRFDPDRPPGHLAFGHGLHFCVGAALARLEAEVAVEGLLDLLPRLRLRPAEIRREPSMMFRGLRALPVGQIARPASAPRPQPGPAGPGTTPEHRRAGAGVSRLHPQS